MTHADKLTHQVKQRHALTLCEHDMMVLAQGIEP